jgi:translation initiation factor IF-3
MQAQQQNTYRVRINGYIRVPQVQVIGSNGDNLGTMETYKALALAKSEGLDLIEINPKALPPIVKIANFGKMQYDAKKKQKEAKKKQKVSEQKELDFRPVTEIFDLAHKLERAKEFLADGDRVKFVCKFRGREMMHKQVGLDKINWLLEQLKDLIATPGPISMEGKDMIIIVSPKASK